MLLVAWVFFAVEALSSLFFALVFWHFWTRSAMPRPVAVRATIIFCLGCLLYLLAAFTLPL